jgi:hypothetical protein
VAKPNSSKSKQKHSQRRGRNQFTKVGLARVIDVAVQKGLSHLTLKFPGGSEVVLPLSQDKQEPPQGKELDQWMEKQRAREVQGT